MKTTLNRRMKLAVGGPILEVAAAARVPLIARQRRKPAEQSFVLFGRGRSGSTVLVDLLDSHPDICCLGEVLRYPTFFPLSYVNRLLAEPDAPIRGFKLLSYQVRDMKRPAHSDALRDWIVENQVRIFHMKRDDLLRHAVSNIYARRREAFHSTDRKADQFKRIEVTPSELLSWMSGSEQLVQFEEDWLGTLPRETIVYERDLSTVERQAATRRRVLNTFGLPADAGHETDLRPVTPRNLDALLSNFDEIRAALERTKYAHFLDTSANDDTAINRSVDIPRP